MEVKFDEEKDMKKNKETKKKRTTLDALLVEKGVAKSKTQANAILVALSLVLFFLSFVILSDTYDIPLELEKISEQSFE